MCLYWRVVCKERLPPKVYYKVAAKTAVSLISLTAANSQANKPFTTCSHVTCLKQKLWDTSQLILEMVLPKKPILRWLTHETKNLWVLKCLQNLKVLHGKNCSTASWYAVQQLCPVVLISPLFKLPWNSTVDFQGLKPKSWKTHFSFYAFSITGIFRAVSNNFGMR